MSNIYVAGIAMTVFGRHLERSLDDLAREALNGALKDHPEYVNAAPHQTWMVRIKVDDPSAVAALLDAAQYEATLG